VRTLETYVRDSDAGAVQALNLLAGTYQQLRESEKAIGVLRRALALMPADDPDRPSIEERIERIEAQRQS
jgi:cytochrome c-type biogenesis protein CcmH/NrfG